MQVTVLNLNEQRKAKCQMCDRLAAETCLVLWHEQSLVHGDLRVCAACAKLLMATIAPANREEVGQK